MPKLRWLRAGLAAAVVLAGSPCLAADPPSEHRLALAKQFFAELHMDRTMDTMMKAMIPVMVAQARKANPNLTADQSQAIQEAVTESMTPLMGKMMDRMIPVYADTFSEKELQDLVDFYGTGSGQAMLAKMPQISSKMAPMMMELMPEMQADMTRRLCARIDCKARNAPPAPKT